VGDEAPRTCSRLQGICRQTFGDHAKNKYKTYSVEGINTTRTNITFEESNFEFIYDMGAI
jgi:hypothetical protein